MSTLMQHIAYHSFLSNGELDLEGFTEHNNLYNEELKELKKRKFKQILEQEFTLETLGSFEKGLSKIIKDNNIRLKAKLALDHNNGFIWITVNPKPGVTLAEFQKKIIKLSNRKLFLETHYVFEQRGTTTEDMGKGFHAHILGKRNLNYKPYKCSECIKNTCKDLVGNKNNQSHLNIQIIGPEYAKDKLDYIMSEKTGLKEDGQPKALAQVIDIAWREKYNIPPYYNGTQKN